MSYAISIKNLEKKYVKFKLGEIDLDIPSGEIVGLIGENGAGKTTLIKSILNIIKIDNGQIKIFNKDYLLNEREIKEDIGVVLDNMFFPEILFVRDIDIVMKDTYKKWDTNLFNEYLGNLNISKDKQIKTLSTGMKKKLQIITALSHHPKLLILDEPTSGLDPVVRSEVLDMFLKFIQDENHTILLSTHITSDLEQIADQIIFINEGKILLNKMSREIIDNYGVLKCDIDDFDNFDKNDIISYRKNKYNYEILVSDRKNILKKYPSVIIDKITLENMMILYIKGERV